VRFDIQSFGFGWFPTRVAGEDGGATAGRPLRRRDFQREVRERRSGLEREEEDKVKMFEN
jgi:hypothetical protein